MTALAGSMAALLPLPAAKWGSSGTFFSKNDIFEDTEGPKNGSKIGKSGKIDIFETIGSRAWIWGHMVSKMVPKLPKMLK